jgi:hypothetical protein
VTTDNDLAERIATELDAHHDRYQQRHLAWDIAWELVGCTCGWNGTHTREHTAQAPATLVRPKEL